jgi:hypothetical protein
MLCRHVLGYKIETLRRQPAFQNRTVAFTLLLLAAA